MAKKAAPKKTTKKPSPEVKVEEVKEIPSAYAIEANKKLNDHLEGLEEYYKAESKEELEVFVDQAFEAMEEFENGPKPLQMHLYEEVASLHKEFKNTKPREFQTCLVLTGQIISHLNECKALI